MNAGTTRKSLLARIHCIQKERCWSDDEYRDILQAVSGKRSAAELDFSGLAKAVAQLGGKAVRVPSAGAKASGASPASEWAFMNRASEEKRPLLRKIYAVCRAMGVGKSYAEGAARRQSGGVDRKLEMMSYHELYRLAQALSTTQRSQQAKAKEVPA